MTLSKSLNEYISACFTGIWVQSHEHHDATIEIARLCKDNNWSLATWDIDRGLEANGQAAPGTSDPLAAIKAIATLAKPDSSALLVLPNFHRFLQSTEVIQALAHQIQAGKTSRTFVIILSPVVQIPLELEKSFVVIDHELPDRGQLEQIARGIATESGEMPSSADDLTKLIDAAAGLTRYEAEGAFSLSLVRHGKLEPQSVWELKSGNGVLMPEGLTRIRRGPAAARTLDSAGSTTVADSLTAQGNQAKRHAGQRTLLVTSASKLCWHRAQVTVLVSAIGYLCSRVRESKSDRGAGASHLPFEPVIDCEDIELLTHRRTSVVHRTTQPI